MKTTKEGGENPQDVREDTLRSKRKKAEELVRDVGLEQPTGLAIFMESAWLKMVEIGKDDESFLDMMIDFCNAVLTAGRSWWEYGVTYEERMDAHASLHPMWMNLVMESIAIKQGMKKEGDWVVDLNE